MKSAIGNVFLIVTAISVVSILTACDENNEVASRSPRISNLLYSPHEVALRLYEDKVTLSGTIDFRDEDGDLATLKISSSAGVNVTAPIADAEGQKQGTITGVLEFFLPSYPSVITFEIWVVDKKGNTSNKLSGSIDVIIDDSANQWLGTSSGVSDALNDVCWGRNQFVAVGDNGSIITSSNGRDWTTRNSGVNTSLHAVTWSGTILSSTDGITWTPKAVGYTNDDLSSVAWSGTNFVACGNNNTEQRGEIFTSPDGGTWTINDFSIASGLITSVTWTGSQFVVVGSITGSHSLILISSDGLTWIDKSIDNGGYILWDVAGSPARIEAVGGAIIVASTDGGATWHSTATAASMGILNTVCYTGRTFAAGGFNGVFISSDGVSWTNAGMITMVKSLAWSGVQYVAITSTGSMIYTSP